MLADTCATGAFNHYQMADLGSWNIFMEWKVFDKIPLEGSISLKELAESVGAEESLISSSHNH